jgi:hypothetical protein
MVTRYDHHGKIRIFQSIPIRVADVIIPGKQQRVTKAVRCCGIEHHPVFTRYAFQPVILLFACRLPSPCGQRLCLR